MWRAGQTVLDRYRLVEQLGKGLGGETWQADGPSGPVAIKLIRGENARAFRDLIREAALLRELRHPNIVAYREFSDRPDDDCAILVMELVGGGDLEAWISLEGPRAPTTTALFGLQILNALEVLEGANILHRDLKPSNILVEDRPGGEVRLRVADFGISRRIQDGIAQTRDRSLTPAYAAPEQHTGGALSRATDLFAVGGVLGFIATARNPSEGRFVTGHPDLDTLIDALRHPDPGQRPSLSHTRAALLAISQDRSPPPPPPPPSAAQNNGVETLIPFPEDSTSPSPPSPPPPAERAPPRSLRAILFFLAVVGALLVAALTQILPTRAVSSSPPAVSVPLSPAPPLPPPEVVPPPPEVVPEPIPEPVPALPPEPTEKRAPVPTPTLTPVGRTSSSGSAVAAEEVVLVVISRPWSWVVVDGTRVGRTTDQGARFSVSRGRHQIRLESEEGLSWEREMVLTGETRVCISLRTGTEFGC